MKKQVCSSLLALTMTLGTVTPALAAETETETNVQSAACTCTAACTEETRNMDCAVCGAEGAPLTDCAQVNVQDDTNNEPQTANAENGFAYTVTGDEATITGYTGSARSLAIPSELGGKPVTAIGEKAFEGYKNIVNIYIPKTIKAIGEDAFLDVFDRNSGNLFVCYQRTKNEWGEIEIQEGNDEIDLPDNSATEDGRILYPKYECNLSGDMVYQASDNAATLVRYFGSDSKVDIPAELGGKPVTEIGMLAFTNCSGLTKVTIPEGVTSIGAGAFQSCGSLTEVTIPKSVETIGDGAFSSCSSLTEVTIPEGVTSIKDSAFQSCSSLTEVTIPKSVTSIGWGAFIECDALTTVHYGGTQKDWDALKKNIGEGNAWLLNANIIYSENSSDYAYSVNDAGDGVTITGYTGSAKNLVIPSELGGKPVTAIGEKAFYKNKTITSVKIPEGVTSIGDNAFSVCDSLTKATIPEGVTSIGDNAFSGCSSLTEVTIPEGVTSIGAGAFSVCDSLTKATIPEGVTSIRGSVFEGCSSLTEVTIPKSVTSIKYAAFYDCGALATVYYGGSQTDWDALKNTIDNGNNPLLNANIICAIQESNGFAYTVTGDEATITGYTGSARSLAIPSELGGKPVTAIADKAFEGYKNMVNIYIPKTIKTIGENAFREKIDEARFICYEGTENEWANIAVQKGNEGLDPEHAGFEPWFRLYECNLSGDMVYQASDDAATLVCYFGSDSKVDIPAELGGKPVTAIGEYAFHHNTTITSVKIPEGVTSIGESAFRWCSSLTEVTIPEGVTSIGVYAFQFCNSLTEVTIPEGVTSIGDGAFESCRSLTKVTISEGVTSIGGTAFAYCSSLTEVTIPKSVTSIEYAAFDGCGALATVYYGGTQEDWDALKKNIGEENNSLLNANIICAIQESNGFAYTVTGDEATITGYTGSARSLVIPSELGGKPVTAIADKAFYGYKTPNIYIPKTIKAIGEDAFAGTVISDEFRFICYEGTENEWANIAIQKGNGELDPEYADDVPWFRLYECNLSGDMVYQASDDAATLVRYLGSDSKVDIPAELGGKPVTSIRGLAFVHCSSLTEATIPEGVTSIGEGAFWYCSSLTKVTIPEGVTSIKDSAFRACRSLTEVTIPKSVTSIGGSAFHDCEALATVYYGGTQEDWDALKKNIGEENNSLLNANVICKEKPKICKGGKEVKISNGAHEMRIHGKSYGTFTFAWVNDKAGWSIQNADGKYLSFDNGKLVLRDTAYVWKYDAKFYTTTEEKTSSGWGWWGRPSTKVTNWYLVGDGTDLSISKSDTNADVKLYDAMESTEHSFGKWTPAEDGKHTRTCTICGATETGDCTYENGACTVCGALDPDNASVSVSATVTKRTSGGGGWWWWNRPTTTTWEARITATGTGVDIDKVEYSDDGKHYLTGTSFTSDTEITKFYIRVTDSKGNVTNWLYENGKVTQK